MACSHIWVRVNDIKICRKCGLTILPDCRAIFDKNLLKKKWGLKNAKD